MQEKLKKHFAPRCLEMKANYAWYGIYGAKMPNKVTSYDSNAFIVSSKSIIQAVDDAQDPNH